jgi:hypothetical protein
MTLLAEASEHMQSLDDFERLSPEEQESHVAALGPQDSAQLIAIAERATNDGIAAFAIERLVDLKVEAAMEPLCALLGRVDRDSERRESLLVSLSCFGAEVVEPLLQMREGLTEEWRRDDVLLALTEREGALAKDERIFAALCEFLPRNPDLGAELLEEYADPRALPLIEQTIERFVPDFESLMSERELRCLLSAHRQLGGELPGPLHARVHVWVDTWNQPVPAPEPVRRTAPKLGRNDPCRCGSGKKFKKCCLGKQEAL